MLGCTTQPWSPKHSECKRPQGMPHLGHRWTRSLSIQGLFFCQLGATEGPGIRYFIKTRRGGCELEGHKPPCSQCAARMGTGPGLPTELLARPPSSSRKGQYRCLSTALRSSPLAQPLSRRHLPQTQHTTAVPHLPKHLPHLGDIPPSCSGQNPRVTFNSTPLRRQGRFLPGAFPLTAPYSQLRHLPLHGHLDPAAAS